MHQPLQLFIAYSRKDTDFLEALRTQLTPLERSGKAKIWYDGKIDPGVVWETAIRENLHAADIILLLVSADAIASDYFYDKEMTDALARHTAGTARVVPLIVRPCAWQATPLGALQALPKDGKAVTSWPDRDEAYADAVASLMRTIDGIQMERTAEAEREERDRRRQEEAQLTAAQETERRQKMAEAQRLAAAEAERRSQQQEAERQQKAEARQQRKAAAAKQREQKVATLGKGVRSPWVWGSGVVGVLALLIGNWICNVGPTAESPMTQQNPDTTTLLENTRAAADSLAGAKSELPEQPKNGNKNEQLIAQEDPPKKEKPAPVFTDPFAADMVRISGGTYKMGDEYGDLWEACLPVHAVTIRNFYLSRYEVTQAQWRAVMGSDPSKLNFKGCDNCPVENVSWNDVQQFIKKLNKLSGKTYRLPSEAEWEFAARGGDESANTKYAGSNDLDEVAWYRTNSGYKTHPVGKKQKNELGLYDMSGNVWEWCQDVWHENYEGAPTNGSAWVSGGDQTRRVVRGGSWGIIDTVYCRVTYRGRDFTGYRGSHFGFRLAR